MKSNRKKPIRLCLDVVAAYNRDELPVPACQGLNVDNVEEVMAHPFHWAYLTEAQAEEVLFELYVARRTRMQ